MDHVYSKFPTAALQVAADAAPALDDPCLSTPECHDFLRQVLATHTKAKAILSFLQSNDPGASMLEPVRERLQATCRELTDTRYLQDEWPGVGPGLRPYPQGLALPAFRQSHQTLLNGKSGALEALAAQVIKISRNNLAFWTARLREDVKQLQEAVNALMTDCYPQVCQKAEQFLAELEGRWAADDIEQCRISRQVQLLKTRCPDLGPTLDATRKLIQLRIGNGDNTSFSMQRYPFFFYEWRLAVKDMELGNWTSFERRLKTLTTMREGLVTPKLPPRHT